MGGNVIFDVTTAVNITHYYFLIFVVVKIIKCSFHIQLRNKENKKLLTDLKTSYGKDLPHHVFYKIVYYTQCSSSLLVLSLSLSLCRWHKIRSCPLHQRKSGFLH